MINNNIQNTNNLKIVSNTMYISCQGFLPVKESEIESILSIGNGYIGTRNSLEEHYNNCNTATLIAGIYDQEPYSEYNSLVKMPDWTYLQIYIDGVRADMIQEKFLEHIRFIDLNNGLCIRNWKSIDSIGRITEINITKFISISNKNEAYKSISIKPENYSGKIKVISGINGNLANSTCINHQINQGDNYITFTLETPSSKKIIAMTQVSQFLHNNANNTLSKNYEYKNNNENKLAFEEWEWNAEVDKTYKINSLISIYTSLDDKNPTQASQKFIANNNSEIYQNSQDSHTEEFKARWKNSEVIILNDDNAQSWLNFALYHLLIAGKFSGNNSSIPARGLSGEAYKGHVFWDTDIFLLPFYTFSSPEIARNLLMYRYNTLDGARKNALEKGLKGADYPWESTDSGSEMTPTKVISLSGNVIPIYSGLFEHHITPDIAYSVWQYWIATYDEYFLANFGAEILFETARFCESLLKKDNDGLYHIYCTIGPDEYHEKINDNSYTNIMVKHNIEIACKTIEILKTLNNQQLEIIKNKINLTDSEIEAWILIKDQIYLGYNSETKLFEQFKGYYNLEYLNLHDYEPRTAPMDLILGRENIEKTQIIKQADVIMFLFLLADKFSLDVVETNYDYYEPRTSHGSSLSPGIHGLVAARLGKKKLAYDYLAQNARIDLKDKMGNASGGVHIAALGGSWMLITMGFAGMYSFEEGLLFNPHLPDHWAKIQFSVFWRTCNIEIEIYQKHIHLNITGDKNTNISLGFNNWKELAPNKTYSAIKKERWDWQ